MLEVVQTTTCDICGCEIKTDTQIVRPGCQIYHIERGPAGVSQWHDVCEYCHGPLLNAVWALKTAKDAE